MKFLFSQIFITYLKHKGKKDRHEGFAAVLFLCPVRSPHLRCLAQTQVELIERRQQNEQREEDGGSHRALTATQNIDKP